MIKEYHKFVESLTADAEPMNKRLQDPQLMHILHAVIGISGEAGELMDAVKKAIVYGKPIDYVNLQEEAGDLLFYLTLLVNESGMNFNDIMLENMKKLRLRYPNSKFTCDDALSRKDKE